AEIDITRPSRGGMHQLTTVYLRYTPTDGWFGERVRYWRGVGAFTPAPDLTAEEEPAMEEGSADEMVIEEEPVEEVPAEEAPVEEAPAVEQ
ncbi:MAG: hypothetical protein MI741_12235, partial [Rhodospirillales bacterium]|nr:hypothetical protein [Rhodospirillales bacterium]